MQLRYVFSELRQGLRRNFSMHLAVILTLFVSLTLVGLGVLLNAQAKKAEDHFGSLLQITVFLCNDAATSPNCTGEVTATSSSPLVAALRADARAAAGGATSCFRPSPSLAVSSAANAVAGANAAPKAIDSASRASTAPRVRPS